MKRVMRVVDAQHCAGISTAKPAPGVAPSQQAELQYDYDDLFPLPPDGFGTLGAQAYLKFGFSWTPLHDDIAGSSAVN